MTKRENLTTGAPLHDYRAPERQSARAPERQSARAPELCLPARAADAMDRAPSTGSGQATTCPRERHDRLSVGARRPAGPASPSSTPSPSPFRPFRLAHAWRACACALVAALALLLGAGTAQAQTAPVLTSATVSGLFLTLTFDGPLDENYAPPGSDFRVYARGGLAYGSGLESRCNGWCRIGVSEVSIFGSTATLTLEEAINGGYRNRAEVWYLRPPTKWPPTNGLRNPSGILVNPFLYRNVTILGDGTPSVTYAESTGMLLYINFNETLDASSLPASRDFHVTVNGERRTVMYNAARIDGATLRLILQLGIRLGTRVEVRYTKGANPLRDTAGNEVESFTEAVLTQHAPAVESIALSSDAGADKTYGVGDTIRVQVTFDFRVGVTGSPRLQIKMDPNFGDKWAVYESGSGTRTLTFAYQVQEPNLSPLGVAVLADTLELNDGTIRFGWAGRWNAELAHSGLAHDANHKVDWQVSPEGGAGGDSGSEPSSVTGVSVVSNAGPDKTYGGGDTIRVRVTFAEPVDVTGLPRLKIDMDPAEWGEKWAAYESGGGTASLTFAHEVAEPNLSTQGIAVLANSLELNSGTIHSGGADAGLAHSGLAHDANHKVNWQTQPESGPIGTSEPGGPVGTSGDSEPPSVSSVAVISDPGADKTYMPGDEIRIRVTFSEAVAVTGGPGIKIDMDPAEWGEKRAAYQSGSGASSLIFVHTVVEPNFSTQGIAVLADTLGGGAIRSAATGADAALGHVGLAHDSGHKVDWRPTLSVADARANEGADAAVTFTVSLSRAFTGAEHSVTVDYATADGTAKAGEDYTAASGTLTFAAGERTKTVSVPILDDAIDEGEETFALRLSNAAGARIADGEATGTIENSDPMPRAWLARFGRTVAGQVLDAVGARVDGGAAPTRVTLGGQEMLLGDAARDALGGELEPGGGPSLAGRRGDLWKGGEDSPAREASMSELLLASSFHLASAEGEKEGPRWSLWGRGARTSFEGTEGALRLSGDVTTGFVGADYESGRVLVGVALALSSGDGSYEEAGMRGEVESSLAGVYPYLRYAVSERLSVWGAAGLGQGDLTLTPAGAAALETDLSMAMAAAGGRGALITSGGFELALRGDLAFVRSESDATAGLAASEADTSRLRLALEGSAGEMGIAGGALTPTVELGLRLDGGDAETGAGLEVGGGLRYASGRLTVELNARGLLAHEEDEYEEWGVSASVRFSPDDAGRGLSLRAASTWGAAAGGVDRLWSQRAAADLARGAFEPGAGVDAEVGYGFDLPRGLLTPYTGVSLSQNAETWRAGARWKLGPAYDLAFEATLTEPANDEGPEGGVLLSGSRRW